VKRIRRSHGKGLTDSSKLSRIGGGAVTCRELTGLDVKTAEGMREYLRSVHDYACTERVKFAVKKAIEILEE